MPEKQVYDIVKTLFEKRDEVALAHGEARAIALDSRTTRTPRSRGSAVGRSRSRNRSTSPESSAPCASSAVGFDRVTAGAPPIPGVAAAASQTASAPPPAATIAARFKFIGSSGIVSMFHTRSPRRADGRKRTFTGVLLFVVHPPGAGSSGPSAPPLDIVAIIPARYGSTRFPGKPLAELDGRPMIEHVYRRAQASPAVSRVIVATDNLRIATTVTGFGGNVRLTRGDHETGTDRLAEVALTLDCDVIVNVQGDEPLIDSRAIGEAVAPFANPSISITTLYRRIVNPSELTDANVVKVVLDRGGFAMLLFAGADPARPRSARRLAAALSTRRALRIPPQRAARPGHARAYTARARRTARAAARARAWHPHQGRRRRTIRSVWTRLRTWNKCVAF